MTRGLGSLHKLPSGSWRAVIYIGGVRVQKAYPRLDMAKRWLQLKRAEKVEIEATGRRITPSGEAFRYEDLADELRAQWAAGLPRVYTDRTLEGYRGELAALLTWWGNRVPTQTTPTDVDRYVAALRKDGLSTSRIRHLLDRLSQLHQLGVRRGLLRAVPCKIDRPRLVQTSEPEILEPAQLAALIAGARAEADPRILAALLLALHAGLRRSEIARLRGEDVLPDAVRVAVRSEADRTKSGRHREIPMLSDELRRALAALAPKRGRPLLAGISRPRHVADLVHDTWARTIGGRPRLHALRHVLATTLAQAGSSAYAQAVLGHGSIVTTQRYIHVKVRDVPPGVAEAVQRLTDVPRGTQQAPESRRKLLKTK